MNDIISDAIQYRRLLRLFYQPGWRTVEPHAFGISKERHELLRAFQTEGASASGEHIPWKLFRVDRADRLELLEETFAGPRPDYKRGDKAMMQIYDQL